MKFEVVSFWKIVVESVSLHTCLILCAMINQNGIILVAPMFRLAICRYGPHNWNPFQWSLAIFFSFYSKYFNLPPQRLPVKPGSHWQTKSSTRSMHCPRLLQATFLVAQSSMLSTNIKRGFQYFVWFDTYNTNIFWSIGHRIINWYIIYFAI